ncbi:MAG: hypothetical protein AAFP22_03140 [Planctomycetota bacterium]
MARHLPAACAAAALLTASCRTAVETTFLPMDSEGWRVGFRRDLGRRVGTITELVPEGQTVQAWSEMVTIQLVAGDGTEDAGSTASDLFAEQRTKYGDAVAHRVIAEDEHSVLYEWTLLAHPIHPDQHEIARLLEGNEGMHRVAYTHKYGELNDAERALWIERLSGAVVVLGDEAIR